MPETLAQSLQTYIEQHQLGRFKRWWVAFSGGVDSSVLLHELSLLRPQFPGIELAAIYIHHGISDNADRWLQHCQHFCQQRNIVFQSISVELANTTRQGLEQRARQARWQAFAQLLDKQDCLWLGHHKDDQVETLMLNLFRGTGVKGAEAMKPLSRKQHYWIARPFLEHSKHSLKQAAEYYELSWVEDESNNDEQLSRNYLRHQVLPAIEKNWPEVKQPLSRFSQHMQQTSRLLDELAEQDYQQVKVSLDPSWSKTFQTVIDSLSLTKLKTLSSDRLVNLLRYRMSTVADYLPSSEKLNEFARQIETATTDGNASLSWSDFRLQQTGEQLFIVTESDFQPIECSKQWVQFPESLDVPELNLRLEAKASDKGIRAPTSDERVTIRTRVGGERCWPDYRNKSTSLKKIFQELDVPHWQRNKWPLVFYNNEMVGAVGLFYCKPFMAADTDLELSDVNISDVKPSEVSISDENSSFESQSKVKNYFELTSTRLKK
jgi:tRNA(Ile)-lysidine synthase